MGTGAWSNAKTPVRDGISGAPLPAGFPYKSIIEQLCFENNCAPCLVGAIKMNETGLDSPPDIVSADGGHGLMQLTSSYPPDWADPQANIAFAIVNFIMPAWTYWAGEGMTGDALIRCIAAEYNAGRGNAQSGHAQGNVDLYTTDMYAARAATKFYSLIRGVIPT